MLTFFPADCCALVVEGEPVLALDLSCMLSSFGCRIVGPAHSAFEALQLLGKRRPSFALFDAHLPARSLGPLAETLTRLEVPFAVLRTGLEIGVFERVAVLRAAPHLTKPFNRWNLHRMASALYQIDLRNKLAATDRRINEGRQRLAQQVRLIERLEVTGVSTALAASLLREIWLALRVMGASRTILCQQLETYGG